jgi:hypothetical protein
MIRHLISATHLNTFWEGGIETIWVTPGTALVVTLICKRFSKRRLCKARLVVGDGGGWHGVKVALCIALTLKGVNLTPRLLNLSAN